MTRCGRGAGADGRYNSCPELVSSKLCGLPANGAGLPMQQVSDWLEKLGLVQYAQRFAENDITVAILPDLTDQDLKELGVASLGHRRQLLRAIVELGNAPATTTPIPPRPSSSPPIRRSPKLLVSAAISR